MGNSIERYQLPLRARNECGQFKLTADSLTSLSLANLEITMVVTILNMVTPTRFPIHE